MTKRILFILMTALVGLSGCAGQSQSRPGSPTGTPPCGEHYIPDWIDFPTASANLTPEAKQVLDAQALWLKCYWGLPLTIQGFASEKPTMAENTALAQRRALATRAYLIGKGVADVRITTMACGAMQAAGSCSTHENVSAQSAFMTLQ